MFDHGGEDRGIDESHEEEGLKYGVGELRRLFEEFGGFVGISHYEAFHLGKDIEELGGGEGRECFGDCVWTCEAWLEVDSGWQWW